MARGCEDFAAAGISDGHVKSFCLKSLKCLEIFAIGVEVPRVAKIFLKKAEISRNYAEVMPRVSEVHVKGFCLENLKMFKNSCDRG